MQDKLTDSQNKYIAVGVDPGSSSGAIAVIKDGILEFHHVHKLTEKGMEQVFYQAYSNAGFGIKLFAVIEKVQSMPGQGVSSSFKFGMNYGFLRGCLVSNAIPFETYHPKKWQKFYSMKKHPGEEKTKWKRRLHEIAQNLYPQNKIPIYAADSVLLAHFAKHLIHNQ